MPEVPKCSVCGGSVRANNKYGICSLTRECLDTKAEIARRANGVQPRGSRGRSTCSVERCTEISHARGLCQAHDRRLRLTGDPGSAEKRSWKRTKILQGDVFDYWTTLGGCDSSSATVLCRCRCGIERTVKAVMLTNGISRSCGCRRRHPQPRTVPYMAAGTVAGRLTALEDAWRSADKIRFRCECGTESSRRAVNVGSGPVRSCGCAQRDYKHGLSYHPLYTVWKAMIARCDDADNPNYGGRGIAVCERWRGSPDGLRNFIADVGERPKGRTLDRIDNDGNYEPRNVRWSTGAEQNANRRTIAGLTAERDALLALLAAAQGSTGRLF